MICPRCGSFIDAGSHAVLTAGMMDLTMKMKMIINLLFFHYFFIICRYDKFIHQLKLNFIKFIILIIF